MSKFLVSTVETYRVDNDIKEPDRHIKVDYDVDYNM